METHTCPSGKRYAYAAVRRRRRLCGGGRLGANGHGTRHKKIEKTKLGEERATSEIRRALAEHRARMEGGENVERAAIRKIAAASSLEGWRTRTLCQARPAAFTILGRSTPPSQRRPLHLDTLPELIVFGFFGHCRPTSMPQNHSQRTDFIACYLARWCAVAPTILRTAPISKRRRQGAARAERQAKVSKGGRAMGQSVAGPSPARESARDKAIIGKLTSSPVGFLETLAIISLHAASIHSTRTQKLNPQAETGRRPAK